MNAAGTAAPSMQSSLVQATQCLHRRRCVWQGRKSVAATYFVTVKEPGLRERGELRPSMPSSSDLVIRHFRVERAPRHVHLEPDKLGRLRPSFVTAKLSRPCESGPSTQSNFVTRASRQSRLVEQALDVGHRVEELVQL
eukprot:905287-Pleurochrysis_carterae.AAC.4